MSEPISLPEPTPSEAGEETGTPVVERLVTCIEAISGEFERWDDPYAMGPGLYFLLESSSVSSFVTPMGSNRWPVEDCASVFDDALLETAEEVALGCDGAVVVHEDGTIASEMVRVKQLAATDDARAEDLPFAEWMGARHMSALETSLRPEVDAVLTLSETDGRTTIFRSGQYEDPSRDTLTNRS